MTRKKELSGVRGMMVHFDRLNEPMQIVFIGAQDGEFVVWTVPDVENPYQQGFDRALISTKSYRLAVAQMRLVYHALKELSESDVAEGMVVPGEVAEAPLIEDFFEIAYLSDNGLRALLGEIENATLLCALAGAPPYFRHRVRSVLNQRARDFFDYDFSRLGRIAASDITAAQEQIVRTLCDMAARDKVLLVDWKYIVED